MMASYLKFKKNLPQDFSGETVFLVFLGYGIFAVCLLKTREKYTNRDNLVCLSFSIFLGQSHLCLLLQKKALCKSNIDGSALKKYTN